MKEIFWSIRHLINNLYFLKIDENKHNFFKGKNGKISLNWPHNIIDDIKGSSNFSSSTGNCLQILTNSLIVLFNNSSLLFLVIFSKLYILYSINTGKFSIR